MITVGGVDTMGTKRTSDDALADWSSRGATQDGVAKPELVAPGAHIVGPYAPGSAFGTAVPDAASSTASTSASAARRWRPPSSSGIVAGLLEQHPDWTPDQVKGALVNNLRTIDGGGRGRGGRRQGRETPTAASSSPTSA